MAADEYQLRKDIDRVITFLDNLEKLDGDGDILAILRDELGKYYDSSDVDFISNKLNDDLSELDSSLNTLTSSLIEFNSELISFDEDNTNLASDLSKLKNNLHTIVSSVNNFSSRLIAAENSLGTTSSDLDKLVYSLNTLTDYLTTFEGTLSEFEDELDDNPDIDVSELNANIITLFGVIGSVKNDVSTAESSINQALSDISDVQEDIYGDGQNKAGIISDLSDLDDTINDSTTGLAVAHSHIGTINQSITGIQGDISDVQGDITTVQTDIGDVDVSVNSDLQTQITVILSLFKEMIPPIIEVDGLPMADGTTVTAPPTGKHYASMEYNYDIVKVKSTGKYYKRINVEGW